MKLHKLEIARLQLETAIDLFLEQDNFLSALTLAGASEEILGKLLERDDKDFILKRLHSYFNEYSEEDIKWREFSKLANLARNSLKHATLEEEDNIEIFRWETIQMIMRAMINYKEMEGDFSEKMKIMDRWIKGSKGKYVSMK